LLASPKGRAKEKSFGRSQEKGCHGYAAKKNQGKDSSLFETLLRTNS